MKKYYVNTNEQLNRDHEVHSIDCNFIPKTENRIYLGDFDNCWEAVSEAKKYYSIVNGCKYCCNECHTR